MQRRVNTWMQCGCGSGKCGYSPVGYCDTEKARVQTTVQPKEALALQDIHYRPIG